MAKALFDFKGQKVLITGGASGIGAASARAFAAAGAQVFATGLSADEVEQAKQQPGFESIDVRVLDVRDHEALSALAQSFDRLDVLVHCAGMIRREAEHDPDVFDEVLLVNLSAGMRLSTMMKPQLARQSGSIVFIASMLSFFGGPKQPAYAASKGAIRQLTMSLAAAYAQDSIRVNAVAPGWIVTNLSRGARDDAARNAMILARTPMARWGQPEEVADPILFLSSDAARFVTGVVLPVDGGFLTM
ncbi:MAG: SDR family NAD(P)-dependent oxidoreductase [Burkholderiales bacterium]